MKTLIIAASLLAATFSNVAMAGSNVSVSIGQPGFYGRIDIGDAPAPAVVYAEPVIVERAPRYVEAPPIYLRVPVGHQHNWKRYCRNYGACGQRVLFVQDNWYRNDFAPRYHREHGNPHRERVIVERREIHYDRDRRDDRHFDRHDDRRDDRHDDHGRGDDRGHGNGHGHGHDRD
jgi:hypothetical protein